MKFHERGLHSAVTWGRGEEVEKELSLQLHNLERLKLLNFQKEIII